MTSADLFLRFGIALAIGFMIGLQREYAFQDAKSELVAGERTFALMGLAGALAAMCADLLNSSLGFVVIILVASLFPAIAYFLEAKNGHHGLTTEFAMIITILCGALSYWDYLSLAAAVGIATTALLSLKLETDRLVRALTRRDIFAALQLAIISLIILPILPNQALLLPPFDVLNPFRIWLMVVFISSINFLGYISIKFVGAQRGIGLTGLLGGLASSTAVTLGLTERSNREQQLARPFALALLVAWTVMFARVLVEVAVVHPRLLVYVWLPVVAAGVVGLLYSFFLYRSQKEAEYESLQFSNPFNLMSAVKFGLLYAVILVAARAAQLYFGQTGIYLSSLISGLVDVDAITLSLAQISLKEEITHEVAAQAIVLATIANTLVKGGIVLVGSAPQLKRAILPGWLLVLATAILLGLLIV